MSLRSRPYKCADVLRANSLKLILHHTYRHLNEMDTSALFRVDGMIAVVTGGATGGFPSYLFLCFKAD